MKQIKLISELEPKKWYYIKEDNGVNTSYPNPVLVYSTGSKKNISFTFINGTDGWQSYIKCDVMLNTYLKPTIIDVTESFKDILDSFMDGIKL